MAEMTMRERIARAIEESMRPICDEAGVDIEVGEITIDAVLAAMREPTEEMLAAAKPEPTHLYGQDGRNEEYEKRMKVAVMVDRLAVASAWRAMIEAAQRLPIHYIPVVEEVPEQ